MPSKSVSNLDRSQNGLVSSVSRSGIGIHTGRETRVTLHPAEVGTGYVFFTNGQEIPALSSHVTDTRRCTTLSSGSISVSTVEHLLAALRGLEVDNAIIEVEGVEMPIFDGSAQPWVEAIREAGIKPEEKPVTWHKISEPVTVEIGTSMYSAVPADTFTLTVVTQFEHAALGERITSHWPSPERFAKCIAPARTFGFQHEIDALRASGLALGGTLENALVVQDDGFSQPLRMADECHVHKLLDVWGDLALSGAWIKAAMVAVRPGHRGNVAFASALNEALSHTAS